MPTDDPFQNPLETGVRVLALLTEAYPAAFDLQRILYFDYLLVHSGDAGGPESLHPNTPLRNGELLVRRGLIERGALLMVTRGLLARYFRDDGILFTATEESAPFLDCLTTPYLVELKGRAQWAISTFGSYSDSELATYFGSNSDRWTREFENKHPSFEISP